MTDTQTFQIIKSSRRSLALEVTRTGGLIIRAPFFISQGQIREFINTNENWIQKKRRQVENLSEFLKPKKYTEGESFLFLGQSYPLKLIDRQNPALALDTFFTLAKLKLNKAPIIFENWYRKEAKALLKDRLDHYTDLMNLQHKNLHVTGARTRWGSCSHDNNVNFTWRLIMAPIEIIDYVIVHELAHIMHKNHSRNFWNLVEKYVPDYKEKRKWLRENGERLSL
jgi:predicted metal-dependent hydrolase